MAIENSPVNSSATPAATSSKPVPSSAVTMQQSALRRISQILVIVVLDSWLGSGGAAATFAGLLMRRFALGWLLPSLLEVLL